MRVGWTRTGHRLALAIGAGVLVIACNADKPSQSGKDAGTVGGADAGGGASAGGTPTGGAGGAAGSGGGGAAGTTDAGKGGSGGAAGTTDAGATGQPDSGSKAVCRPSCASPTPICENGTCAECGVGSAQCAGGAPQHCQGGRWVSDPACSGATPACTNGVCAAAKLVGGVVTVARGVLSSGSVRLVRHGFEFGAKTCASVGGSRVCVTGGLLP